MLYYDRTDADAEDECRVRAHMELRSGMDKTCRYQRYIVIYRDNKTTN